MRDEIKNRIFFHPSSLIPHPSPMAPPSLRAGGFAPAVRQRRTAFCVHLSARQIARNNAAGQITALTPPSPLPFATAVTAVPDDADTRPVAGPRPCQSPQRQRGQSNLSPSLTLRALIKTKKDAGDVKPRRRQRKGRGIWVGVGGRPPERWVPADLGQAAARGSAGKVTP